MLTVVSCLLLAHPPAAAGGELAQLELVTKTLAYVQSGYADPARVKPRAMLQGALRGLQRVAPEIQVSEMGPRVAVGVAGDLENVDLGPLESLAQLTSTLRRIGAHLEPRLGARDPTALEVGLLSGMLAELDPYSTALAPAAYSGLKQSAKGAFGGLGIVIQLREGNLLIVNTLPNAPGARAGLQRGDKVLAIDGLPTHGMSLEEATDRLRGAPGTQVALTLDRGNGAPTQQSVTRETITPPSAQVRRLDDRVGYLRISAFTAKTAEQVTASLVDLRKQGALTGLVLDLRGCPGGLLSAVSSVADLFVASGRLYSTVGYSGRNHEDQDAKRGDAFEDLPLVVLEDEGTMSGAEILAGALAARDRALLLGRTSFGKGLVQVLYDLPRGAGLKLSIAEYRIDDRSFAEAGLAPDIELVPSSGWPDPPAHRTRPAVGRPAALLTYVAPPETGEAPATDPLIELAADVLHRSPSTSRAVLLETARKAATDRARAGVLTLGAPAPPSAKPAVSETHADGASAPSGTSSAVAAAKPAVSWPNLAAPAARQGGGERDAAVVVGIEEYMAVPRIPGAVTNADAWYAYLTQTRRVPVESVTLLRNNEGTVEKLRKYVREAAAQVKPGGTLWFVFIGHGAPAADGKDGVLVGFDAQQDADSLYARSLAQSELLALATKGKQARAVLVLDACFSGRGSNGEPLVARLQPLIALTPTKPSTKGITLLTAGKADQFAGPLPGANRPAFSYLILGALRGWADEDGNGQVTATEAVEYADRALRALVKSRSQTPQLWGDGASSPLSRSTGEKGPDLSELVLQQER